MIPKQKSPFKVLTYCPKCGSFGFTPDGENSLICKSCNFRFFINMSAAVAAIIRNGMDEVLFTIRKLDPGAGLLDLPGGFVEIGETAEEAIKREIKEELNLEIVEMQFYGSFPNQYLFGDIIYHTLDLFFLCKVASFQDIMAADDVSGFIFRKPASVKAEEIGLDSISFMVRKL